MHANFSHQEWTGLAAFMGQGLLHHVVDGVLQFQGATDAMRDLLVAG